MLIKQRQQGAMSLTVFLCFGNRGWMSAVQARSGQSFLWVLCGPPAGSSLYPTNADLGDLLPAHAAVGGFGLRDPLRLELDPGEPVARRADGAVAAARGPAHVRVPARVRGGRRRGHGGEQEAGQLRGGRGAGARGAEPDGRRVGGGAEGAGEGRGDEGRVPEGRGGGRVLGRRASEARERDLIRRRGAAAVTSGWGETRTRPAGLWSEMARRRQCAMINFIALCAIQCLCSLCVCV